MTHNPAPSGYHHDPERDTSCTWPHLTDDQRQVIGLLGFDAGHGRGPRLTVAEMATVDEVVRWAERRQDVGKVARVGEYRGEAAEGLEGDLCRFRGTVDGEMTA